MKKQTFKKILAGVMVFSITSTQAAYASGPMCSSTPFWAQVARLKQQSASKDSGLKDRIDGFNLVIEAMWPELVAKAQTDPALASILFRISKQVHIADEVEINYDTYLNIGDPFGPSDPNFLVRNDISFKSVENNAQIFLDSKPKDFSELSSLGGVYAAKDAAFSFFNEAFAGSSPWMPNGIGVSAGGEVITKLGIDKSLIPDSDPSPRLRVGLGASVFADYMDDPTGEWNLNLAMNIHQRSDLWPNLDGGRELSVGYGVNYYTSMQDQTFDFKCYKGARYPYNNIMLAGTLLQYGTPQSVEKKINVGIGVYPNWKPQNVNGVYKYVFAYPTTSGNQLFDNLIGAFIQKSNALSTGFTTQPNIPDSIFTQAKNNLPTYVEVQKGEPTTPRDPSQSSFMSALFSLPTRQAMNISSCIRFNAIYSEITGGIPGQRFYIVPNTTATFFNGAESNGLSMDNILLGVGAVTGSVTAAATAYATRSPQIAFWAGMGAFLVPMAPAVVQAGYCASANTHAMMFFGQPVPAKCVEKNMQFSTAEEYDALAKAIDEKLTAIGNKLASQLNISVSEQKIMDGFNKMRQSISGVSTSFSNWYNQ